MRKCSHCSHNGHNSRTCPNKGLKLFGVRLTDGIRKSASMGNLSHYAGSSGGATEGNERGEGADGYASEDFVPGSSSSCRDRKKGIPWTEEEHRMFLLGLQKLGKGDWKGISRSFVISRTPTQVASHAQKYFIRQCNASRRKRRSSLFDIVADESSKVPQSLQAYDSEPCEDTLLSGSQSLENECILFDAVNHFDPTISLPSPVCYPVALPACFPPIGLFPLPFHSDNSAETPAKEMHKIIRPTPVHLKAPLNIDELLGISKLSIGEPLKGRMPNLSLKLIGAQDRQSAFNTNLPSRSSDVNSISSAVPATAT